MYRLKSLEQYLVRNQLLLTPILASRGLQSQRVKNRPSPKLNFLWSIILIRVWGTIFGSNGLLLTSILASTGPQSHKGHHHQNSNLIENQSDKENNFFEQKIFAPCENSDLDWDFKNVWYLQKKFKYSFKNLKQKLNEIRF